MTPGLRRGVVGNLSCIDKEAAMSFPAVSDFVWKLRYVGVNRCLGCVCVEVPIYWGHLNQRCDLVLHR